MLQIAEIKIFMTKTCYTVHTNTNTSLTNNVTVILEVLWFNGVATAYYRAAAWIGYYRIFSVYFKIYG